MDLIMEYEGVDWTHLTLMNMIMNQQVPLLFLVQLRHY